MREALQLLRDEDELDYVLGELDIKYQSLIVIAHTHHGKSTR